MKATKVKKMIVSIMLMAFLCTTSMNTYTIKSAGLDDSVKTQLLAQSDSGFKTDRFIIKYKNEEDAAKVGKAIKSGVYKTKKIKGKKNNLNSITLKEKKSAQGLISELKQKSLDKCIEYIQPDYKLTLSSNDPYFSSQWGLGSTVSGEVYSGSTNIESAWEESQGEGVTIGIIDTAIDINHEDLKENIWVNTGEIAGNGIDDDGNGYLDDTAGWNFSEDNNVVNTGDMDHGTHIAGIIAAVKDNGKGIAGVAPKAKVMPLKVFSNGQAYTSDIIEAIEYAEKMGVKVINGSWGSNDDNQALKEAIEGSSMLFVCAAGNSGINMDESPVYPASYASDNVIAVASVDRNGNLASDSNYGANTVDVAAPGVKIIGTLPGNIYSEKSGTSMAAGFVSGEAALVLEKYKDYSAKDVKDKIADTSLIVNGLTIVDVAGSVINATQVSIEVDTPEQQQTVAHSVYNEAYSNGYSLYSGTTYTYEATAPVFSLPANTVTGQMNASIYGNTLVNLLGNDGDCEDVSKWNTWQTAVTLDSTNKLYNDNGFKIMLTGSMGNISKIIDTKIDPLKYYMFSAYLKNGNSLGIAIGKEVNGGGQSKWSASITDTTKFTRVCIKFQPGDIVSGNYFDVCISSGVNAQYAYVDGIMLNEISESDYNLTDEELMKKYHYVNAIKSTNNIRIKSVSKNQFNFEGELYEHTPEISFIHRDNGFLIKAANSWQSIDYKVKVKPNTQYTLSRSITAINSGTNQDNGIITIHDGSISRYWEIWNGYIRRNESSKTFVSPTSGELIIRFNPTFSTKESTEFEYTNIQLEEGNTPTNYKPYIENSNYVMELNSLLNGGIDKVNLSTGTLTQEINKKAIDGDLDWCYNYSTIDYTQVSAYIDLPNIFYEAMLIKDSGKKLFRDMISSPLAKQDTFNVANTIWITISNQDSGWAANYVPSQQDIKNYFDAHPYTLIYQLAQPQTYKINTSPLIAYPNGTIIVEPAVKNVNSYTATGITVQNKELPIKFIESVYKLDGSLMSPVDMSKVHVASNGLSFTIDGAKPGEDYEYVYQYDQSLTTLPTIKYSVPTNQAAQIEGNTDMIELLTKKIELLEERLKAIESDRAVQYEYDSNGRLIRRLKN